MNDVARNMSNIWAAAESFFSKSIVMLGVSIEPVSRVWMDKIADGCFRGVSKHVLCISTKVDVLKPENGCGHFGLKLKSGHHTPPEFLTVGGDMDRPGWTSGYSKWSPSKQKIGGDQGSKPVTLFSLPSRPSEESKKEKRTSKSTPRSEDKQSRLGRIESSFAAGAWAARDEIASLLEAGVPPDEILAETRTGQEGDRRLPAVQKLRAGRSRSLLTSLASGRRSEKRSRSPPRGTNQSGRSNFESTSFRKKARPPSEEPGTPESGGYSPGSSLAGGKLKPRESKSSGVLPPDPTLFFRKRAYPPEEEVRPPPISKDYDEVRIPMRKGPRTADKYRTYDQRVLKLFEDLAILGVKMDLVPLVSTDDIPEIRREEVPSVDRPKIPRYRCQVR